MTKPLPIEDFAPPFEQDSYPKKDEKNLKPFFTNLNKSAYVPLIFSPEVIGALCSRTSRAAEDLRPIFLKEYIKPFLEKPKETSQRVARLGGPPGTASSEAEPSDAVAGGKSGETGPADLEIDYGEHLREFIAFLQKHPIEEIFSNPQARGLYAKWLAQYGDDSIAQMSGMHVVYSGISQLAIKHFEDQRIGLAPIEKSTRYVDYSKKVNGGYMYYTDPTLKELGLEKEYRAAMDNLFETYIDLLPKLQDWLAKEFPKEKPGVIEKKAFDTLRGLLPVATLSQVAFFGNGQAFEYMIARSLKHQLGEIRWAAQETLDELWKVTPSFLRRLKDDEGKETAEAYQEYMAGRGDRVAKFVDEIESERVAQRSAEPSDAVARGKSGKTGPRGEVVQLTEYDPEGQEKVIAGMLYNAPNNQTSWEETLAAVKEMDDSKKRDIIASYLAGRSQRWQKVGRAFENAYVRFDITMNIGSWRDLHRHRMLTQQLQLWNSKHPALPIPTAPLSSKPRLFIIKSPSTIHTSHNTQLP